MCKFTRTSDLWLVSADILSPSHAPYKNSPCNKGTFYWSESISVPSRMSFSFIVASLTGRSTTDPDPIMIPLNDYAF